MRVKIGERDFDIEEPRRGGLRWAIGDPDGPRSSTWRFWGNKKGDFYLAARSLGGTLKTSFHRDGRCHSGLTSEYLNRIRGEGQVATRKYFDRWELASEPSVRAYQILVPAGELRLFRPDAVDQMKWIPGPPPGHAITVSLFLSRTLESDEHWPGANFGSEPIGVAVASGRVAWLVAKAHPLTPEIISEIETCREQVSARIARDPAAATRLQKETDRTGIRVIVAGNRPTQERFCIELASDALSSAA